MLFYKINLFDKNGKSISVENPFYVYPSLAIQLYKQDVIFSSYEYKHQMQTVVLTKDMFASKFDFNSVVSLSIEFDGSSDGKIIFDDLAFR